MAQLEALRIKEDKEVFQFYTKLLNLVTTMRSLGEDISESKVVQKVLRSFLKRFRLKVMVIEESKDLESIKLEELIGPLQTFKEEEGHFP